MKLTSDRAVYEAAFARVHPGKEPRGPGPYFELAETAGEPLYPADVDAVKTFEALAEEVSAAQPELPYKRCVEQTEHGR